MGFAWLWNKRKDLYANSAEGKWTLPNGCRKYGVSLKTPFLDGWTWWDVFKLEALERFPGLLRHEPPKTSLAQSLQVNFRQSGNFWEGLNTQDSTAIRQRLQALCRMRGLYWVGSISRFVKSTLRWRPSPRWRMSGFICRHFCGLKRYDFIEPNQENKLGNNRSRVNIIYMLESLQFLWLISIQESSKHLGYNMLNQITQPTNEAEASDEGALGIALAYDGADSTEPWANGWPWRAIKFWCNRNMFI